MKFVIEMNKSTQEIFRKVLGTADAKAIADEIHKIILAEMEWNSNYSKHFKGSEAEFYVYPKEK